MRIQSTCFRWKVQKNSVFQEGYTGWEHTLLVTYSIANLEENLLVSEVSSTSRKSYSYMGKTTKTIMII